jgi:hypothetical protein
VSLGQNSPSSRKTTADVGIVALLDGKNNIGVKMDIHYFSLGFPPRHCRKKIARSSEMKTLPIHRAA